MSIEKTTTGPINMKGWRPPSRIRVADSERLIAALQWVDQVHPSGDEECGAFVKMTWVEWNETRVALGLPSQQPLPKRKDARNVGS